MTSVLLVRKSIGTSAACVMMELQVPSNRRSPMGGTMVVGMLWWSTKCLSMKQCEELESMRVRTGREKEGIVRGT